MLAYPSFRIAEGENMVVFVEPLPYKLLRLGTDGIGFYQQIICIGYLHSAG